MAGGFAPAATGGHKIKGGRWTVFRFFLVSVAFTSTWVAVSSQLGYYRNIHGPAVLLQLNIAYFLPSIPLLIVSAFLDRPLEARLGVAKTILVRLLLGLLGYGAVTAWFPFMPERIWYLLGAVVALGLFSGIAFSASYQLVARFANKNVIALGLGCSASGPLVLAMQLALRMGPTPTRQQQILLFEIIALVIVAGLWATASLLLRHWRSIEHAAGKQALTEPLLSPRQQEQHPEGEDLHPALSLGTPATPAAAAIALVAAAEEGMPLLPSPRGEAAAQTSPRQLLAFGESLWKQRSLPPLVAYSSLEPYQSPFLTNDQELEAAVFHASWAEERSALTEAAEEDEDGGASDGVRGRGLARGQGRSERQLSAPPAVLLDSLPEGVVASPYAAGGEGAGGPGVPSFKTSVEYVSADGEVSHPAGHVQIEAAAAVAEAPAAGEDAAAGGSTSWQAFKLIWAPLAALSLSSTVALTLFPFFTYVPTSGLLGETLPKVLFFVRIFADVLGRFLPRLSLLAAQSPLTPLLVAGAKLAGVPILLLYLKSPEPLHSDVFAVFLIALIWVLGGYINTMSNMLAPRLAPPQLKGAAAGLMAIAYQAAHFVGLALATLLVYLMYGHIGVE